MFLSWLILFWVWPRMWLSRPYAKNHMKLCSGQLSKFSNKQIKAQTFEGLAYLKKGQKQDWKKGVNSLGIDKVIQVVFLMIQIPEDCSGMAVKSCGKLLATSYQKLDIFRRPLSFKLNLSWSAVSVSIFNKNNPH